MRPPENEITSAITARVKSQEKLFTREKLANMSTNWKDKKSKNW